MQPQSNQTNAPLMGMTTSGPENWIGFGSKFHVDFQKGTVATRWRM